LFNSEVVLFPLSSRRIEAYFTQRDSFLKMSTVLRPSGDADVKVRIALRHPEKESFQ
jgi:hypothetical protein